MSSGRTRDYRPHALLSRFGRAVLTAQNPRKVHHRPDPCVFRPLAAERYVFFFFLFFSFFTRHRSQPEPTVSSPRRPSSSSPVVVCPRLSVFPDSKTKSRKNAHRRRRPCPRVSYAARAAPYRQRTVVVVKDDPRRRPTTTVSSVAATAAAADDEPAVVRALTLSPDDREKRQQHRRGVAPVPPPGPVRRLVPGQRVRRPGDMQAGGRPRPGRHRRVQPVAPQPAAAVGAHVARGGRRQRVLHAGGVGRHPGGVQVRRGQGVLRPQPGPLVRQQHAGAAAGGALRRVRGGQGRAGAHTQAPAQAVAQGQTAPGRHSAQLAALHYPGTAMAPYGGLMSVVVIVSTRYPIVIVDHVGHVDLAISLDQPFDIPFLPSDSYPTGRLRSIGS